MSNGKVKKNKSKRYNYRFITFIIITAIISISLIISIKNLYIYNKCKDPLYAIDYYLTNYKDNDIRLVNVESISILEENNGKLTIDAYGMNYAKPYIKINVLSTFQKNDKGKWEIIDAILN